MTLGAFLTMMGLQAMIAMSPGPAGVLAIKTAASAGLRTGLALALGLALAIVVWASAALAGLSLLFEVAPFAQTGLRLLGAAFLVYVGVSLWRNASEPLPDPGSAPDRGRWHTLWLGLVTNLANPKALAYFTAVFAGLLPPEGGAGLAALILVCVFVIEFAWYATLVLVFSRAAPRRLYARLKRRLDRVFGVAVAALGARIALP